jgi:hypothetical protein
MAEKRGNRLKAEAGAAGGGEMAESRRPGKQQSCHHGY